jgi:tetratricopeptide (TPR) repeat protein
MRFANIIASFFALLLVLGCVSNRGNPSERFAGAKAIFDRTTKEFHIPSAEAEGAKREELLRQSTRGYESLLRRYPDQDIWCAQALRSLGNLQASRGNWDRAVQYYEKVGKKYPKQEWEVLQSWKSAGDLLWDAGKEAQAKVFYQQLVERFDNAEATALYRLIVKTAKTRLSER